MTQIEKLEHLISRKAKADSLPESVRLDFADEYEKIRMEIAVAAVDVVKMVYDKAERIKQAADLVAETLATEDYPALIERARVFQSDFEQELAALEAVDWTPWGKTVTLRQDSRDGGRV